jgi:hypothetical protein
MPPGSSTDATPTRELQAMSWSMERPIQARFEYGEPVFGYVRSPLKGNARWERIKWKTKTHVRCSMEVLWS